MTELQKPAEGTFHYLPAFGVVMAHYPKTVKGSRYAKDGDALLVPANFKSANGTRFIEMDDTAIARLQPVPSKEEFEQAHTKASKINRGVKLSTDELRAMLQSDNIQDVGTVGGYFHGREDNKELERLTTYAFNILISVNFYHRRIADDPSLKTTRRLVTDGSKKFLERHKDNFRRDTYIVINGGSDTLEASKAAEVDAMMAQVKADNKLSAGMPGVFKTPQPPSFDPLAVKLPFGQPTANKPLGAPFALASTSAAKKPTAKTAAPAKITKPTAAPEKVEEPQLQKSAQKPQDGITDEQRIVVAEAVEAASAIDNAAPSSIGSKRLQELFEVGKIGFEDTVILLRHIFAKPAKDAEETARILKEADPEVQTSAADIEQKLGRLKKSMKKKFAKSTNPAEQAIHKVVFDWRPTGP